MEATRVHRLPTEPRHATLGASLLFALCTLLLAYRAVGGAFLANTRSDQYIGGFPMRQFAAAWERAHHSVPMWDPYIFGGLPFLGAMHGDAFYPTAALRLLVPVDAAITWGISAHIFLAGLFTYLFLRRSGISYAGALVGGIGYMMGGNVAGLVSPGHDGKLFVATLLPLVLLLLHRGIRTGWPTSWGALALVVMLAVLSPHPQALQYLLLCGGAYALFVALGTEDGTALPKPVALRRLGLALAAVVIGLLGGAIQFAPVLEYTAWSPRAGGPGWEHAISYSMPPEEMLNFVLPQFSGILDAYWGRNFIHFHSEYLGVAVLMLAGLAFGGAARTRRQTQFWLGVFVVTLLWALGGYTPFFHVVYALVPGTKFFRAPSVILYVLAFATAMLAAVGADRLFNDPPRIRYAVAWILASVLVVVLAVGGLFTSLGTNLAPERIKAVVANAPAVAWGAARILAVVLAMAAVIAGVTRGMLRPAVAAGLLVAVVVIDLWSVERLYWQFSPPAAQLYATDPAIEYLKGIAQPGRVVPLALAPVSHPRNDPYLRGGDGRVDGLMAHRIRSVVGYHGNELARYDALTGWDNDWPRMLGNPNLRRLLNIRFLYTNSPTPPIAGMQLLVGPVVNVAGNVIYLYRFPGDNPAAWIVPAAVEAPDATALSALTDPRFDVGRLAIADSSRALPTVPVPAVLPEATPIPVTTELWEPGHIVLKLARPAPAGTTLIVSENYYPGWKAFIDQKPAPVGRVDYVLIGVALPAGAQRIDLSFASHRYEIGKWITMTAVLCAVGWLVLGLLQARRMRPNQPTVA